MSEVAAMNGEVKVNVRYNGTNLIPINCHGNDTVYDLAEKMKQNAAKFGLGGDAIKINTLRLHLRNDAGKIRKLHFHEEISVTEKCTVEFGKDENEVRCLVSFINSENIVFKCETDKQVFELIKDITERLREFNLKGNAAREATDPDYEIVLKNAEDAWYGEGKTIGKREIIGNLDSTNFKFFFRLDIEKIRKRLGYRRIAFFGAPGHGKSSTINTIYKVLQESEKSVASTWTKATTGTRLLTPYRFDGVDRKFTCVDVPGDSMRAMPIYKAKNTISDILDGKMPINETLDYWSWFWPIAWRKYFTKARTGPMHAIVYVHKGNAESVETYASEILAVSQLKGIGIPVFGVITHIDELGTEEKITKACKDLSLALGIDPSNIFTIANTDHCERKSQPVNRSEDVKEMLDVILSAAENVMLGGKLQIKYNKR